jgi:hypothetical protein
VDVHVPVNAVGAGRDRRGCSGRAGAGDGDGDGARGRGRGREELEPLALRLCQVAAVELADRSVRGQPPTTIPLRPPRPIVV